MLNIKSLQTVLLAFALTVSGIAYAHSAHGSKGGRIVALAFDASGRILVKASSHALQQSSDGGRSWNRIATPVTGKPGRIAAVAISRKGKGAWYVAGPGMGILRSDDAGKTWETRNKGLPDANVVAFALHADQPDTAYAVVAGFGIYRSDDGGANWRLMDKGPREGIGQLVHSNMPGSMQTGWLYAATSKGVGRAMDCFCGWRDAGGLKGKIIAVSYDPARPQHVYAATSDALFSSINGGEKWTRTDAPVESIAALVVTSAGALYAASIDGVLYRSVDHGATWERIIG